MTSEGLGEIFENEFADMCGETIPHIRLVLSAYKIHINSKYVALLVLHYFIITNLESC